MSADRQRRDFAAPISARGPTSWCAAPESVHVSANAQGLRPERAPLGSGAADPFRGTSNRSWKDRGLASDSTVAAAAVRFPEATGLFDMWFRQRTVDDR